MSAINWATIKDALHAWIVAGSGLAAGRVIFSGQNLGRPPGDDASITIKFSGIVTEKLWSITYKDNPSPSPGAELLKIAKAEAEITYQLTCWPPSTATDATEAHSYLQEVIANGQLDARKEVLKAAGIGFPRFETVLPLDGFVNVTRFEPRAVVTFRFYTTAQITQSITYIETVNVELDTTEPAHDFDFTIDLDP